MSCGVLEVRDQGPGIATDVLPHIFERFTAGPNSVGLGLGLYLAKSIAAAHGGDLTVRLLPARAPGSSSRCRRSATWWPEMTTTSASSCVQRHPRQAVPPRPRA